MTWQKHPESPRIFRLGWEAWNTKIRGGVGKVTSPSLPALLVEEFIILIIVNSAISANHSQVHGWLVFVIVVHFFYIQLVYKIVKE